MYSQVTGEMHEGVKWHQIVIVHDGFEKKRMLLLASVDFVQYMAGEEAQQTQGRDELSAQSKC